MTLEIFITTYFRALKEAKITFCVLRNHEGLPETNAGSDLDLLMHRDDIAKALELLAKLPGIVMTDILERTYVVGTFLFGVNEQGLNVDFVTSLSWKGQAYLDVEEVLRRTETHPNSALIPIPHYVDEAIISFFSSYLIGGFIKEKYASRFTPVFAEGKKAVVERLQKRINQPLLERLLDCVSAGSHPEALGLLSRLRRSLLWEAFKRTPMASTVALLNHYCREVWIRITPELLTTVIFLGPDGAGKSGVLSLVQERLSAVTSIIERVHLRRRLLDRGRVSEVGAPVTDPHGRRPKGRVFSYLQLYLWLLESWIDRWTLFKRDGMLRLFDRYFYDILVDPKRYRYGGSAFFAKGIARFVPRPDLVILLDAPAEVLHSRKQEVPFAETVRQREAYLQLAKELPNNHVVDASRPLEKVVADVEAIILDHMAERARKRLNRDFGV